MRTSLEASYAYCRQVARTRARNFYYSFLLLDEQRKSGMCALYAFNRTCDDLSDETPLDAAAVRRALTDWRTQLDSALAGTYSDHPVWPAFHDTVKRYQIPQRFFHEMIDGVTSDLDPKQPRTFGELYEYCYRVASAVGLSVLHVFGFSSEDALPLAEKCGIAFQLTNILRDVGEVLAWVACTSRPKISSASESIQSVFAMACQKASLSISCASKHHGRGNITVNHPTFQNWWRRRAGSLFES